MKNQTRAIFNVMNILFWIIFIGLCIRTGTLIFNLILNSHEVITEIRENDYAPVIHNNNLFEFSTTHYYNVVSLIIIFSALQAHMAYLVVSIFRKLKLEKPFNEKITSLISRISLVALGAGILAIAGEAYTTWINKQGITIPNNWDGEGFIFLAGIIFILAQIFKRGTELQAENELTV